MLTRQEIITARLYDLIVHRAQQSRDGRAYGLDVPTIIWTLQARYGERPTVGEVIEGLNRLAFARKIVVRYDPHHGKAIEIIGKVPGKVCG